MAWFGWLGLAAFILFGAFALLMATVSSPYGSANDPKPHDVWQVAVLAVVGLGVMIWGAVA